MNRQRRETIIQEIKYWKRSRLLPEHYCDYLLALYTEGGARSRGRRWRSPLAAGLCLLLPAVALVIYFTELSFVLQTLLFALFLAVCLFFCWRWRNERELLHFPLIGSAWILLVAAIAGSEQYFPGQTGALAAVVLGNCVLWFVVGHLLRLRYFSLAAVSGALLVAAVALWR
ncbi:hypothetical protein RA955_03190 [Geobacillus proteiniphilus]|uniref:DUF2157 domain-containing protein n=1 Tax=Geobacillus proteiniphilus TaxID=860353 RepID=A0A1Q5STB8_9BACL|nr:MULTISPECIES: hypothetical protein [Geobacillus]OKO91257.1 hypothetical protein BRO54_2795 [Geobacillus proteiniphilus]OPX02353.1 hypothetical protein B1A75_13285 [Geobacillus sp. LEMMY01]WMJ17144.1 hypothetical protein RA955_03190 [Geobacillus proteiniphilus]